MQKMQHKKRRHGSLALVQGWMPKRGEQYGGDWVLYQRHPEVEHADYVVRYVSWPPHGATPPDQGHASQPSQLRWPELVATIRVAGQVRKRVILLYVQFPVDADLTAPTCINEVKV